MSEMQRPRGIIISKESYEELRNNIPPQDFWDKLKKQRESIDIEHLHSLYKNEDK